MNHRLGDSRNTLAGTGFTLAINMKAGQLDITVGVPSEFKSKIQGLIGVFNSDPSDDLLPADGGKTVNSRRLNERDIFYEFGETCKYQVQHNGTGMQYII